MATLTVPFMKMEAPFSELKELIEKVWDWWMEEGKNRERLGELIQRKSFQEFLRVTELDPDPRMVDEPRSNPYIFWKEEEVEGGWTRDIEAYRKKHQR
jgi:sulfite reductase alpha subunit